MRCFELHFGLVATPLLLCALTACRTSPASSDLGVVPPAPGGEGTVVTVPLAAATGAPEGSRGPLRPLHPSADGGLADATVSEASPMADAGVDAPKDAPSSLDAAGPDAANASDASGVGSWQSLTNPPPFYPDIPLLLTDGTILVHSYLDTSTWWALTPDETGSYVNGTWSARATMPPGLSPQFFASAVLPTGMVVIFGGEYDRGSIVEGAQGAIYDPVADVWTPVDPPPGWMQVGDAPSVVLANGVFMMGSSETYTQALFDPRTLSWTMTGAGKADPNAEEGWTLLPNGEVLTVDVYDATNTELYDPTTGGWTSAGATPAPLADTTTTEIGPAVLLPSGAVFATGATPHTALYGPDGGWTPGPDFPDVDAGPLDITDGPAVVLPNGHVLCVASPLAYQTGAQYFEFDGTTLSPVGGPPNAPYDSSFNVYLFVLPTGQILAIDLSLDVEVYTPAGGPNPAWAPTITTVATTLAPGSTNPLVGKQLNGLTQAVAYGDDYQGATNYPLVRITNDATGHVSYARTHDHSTMAVATGTQEVSTLFDVPSGIETGSSHLVVVANGIPSAAVSVTVQ